MLQIKVLVLAVVCCVISDCAESNAVEAILKENNHLKANLQSLEEELKLCYENGAPCNASQVQPVQEGDLKWVPWSGTNTLPIRAVYAGNNWDGNPMYVGRVRMDGADIVAKVFPKDKAAYLAYKGREISVRDCEVLTGSGFEWQTSFDGRVPRNAVLAGSASTGEPHYIGRAQHTSQLDPALTPGTVSRSRGGLTISFVKEVFYPQYQVLVNGNAK